MFNLISILTAIIALPEPAIEDDDTVEFIPLTQHFDAIDLRPVLSLDQLHGAAVGYKLTGTAHWITGWITSTEETKFGGVNVYFEPDTKTHPGAVAKWRNVNEVFYAVWR